MTFLERADAAWARLGAAPTLAELTAELSQLESIAPDAPEATVLEAWYMRKRDLEHTATVTAR